MKLSKERIASFYLLLTAVIWGFAFVAQRVGASQAGSFVFNGIRFLLGALTLIPVILIFDRKDKSKTKDIIKTGLFGGIILFLASSVQQLGIDITQSAGKSGFLTGLYIILVPLIQIFFGKKPGVFVFIGAISALTGMYFLTIPDGLGSVGFGDILLIVGAFFWAVHILYIDKYAGTVSSLKFSFTQFIVCGIIFLVVALFVERNTASLDGVMSAWVSILYMGFLSVGLAYTLQVIGQKHVAPGKAAIIFCGESLFAAIGGALILGETMTAKGYLGCALIFIGIVVSQLAVPKKKAKPLAR
jgi:drug/metabolite transporter (DMT)-like permease